MILNKSSVERGMFHGQIYQVKYLTQLIKLSGFECIIVNFSWHFILRCRDFVSSWSFCRLLWISSFLLELHYCLLFILEDFLSSYICFSLSQLILCLYKKKIGTSLLINFSICESYTPPNMFLLHSMQPCNGLILDLTWQRIFFHDCFGRQKLLT